MGIQGQDSQQSTSPKMKLVTVSLAVYFAIFSVSIALPFGSWGTSGWGDGTCGNWTNGTWGNGTWGNWTDNWGHNGTFGTWGNWTDNWGNNGTWGNWTDNTWGTWGK